MYCFPPLRQITKKKKKKLHPSAAALSSVTVQTHCGPAVMQFASSLARKGSGVEVLRVFAYLCDSCELRWQLHRYSETPRLFSSNRRVRAPSSGQRGFRVGPPTLLKAVTRRLDRRQVTSMTLGKSGHGRYRKWTWLTWRVDKGLLHIFLFFINVHNGF